jgi:Protein of unknown function (DUF1566)
MTAPFARLPLRRRACFLQHARVLPALLAAVAPACGSERAITETLVVVDSDLTPGTELARVGVDVYAADGRGAPLGGQVFDVARAGSGPGSAHTLPLSFGVAPNGGVSSRTFRVVVRGLAAGASSPSVSTQVIGAFVPGETRRLDVFLARSCLGAVCQNDANGVALTTCVAGACVPVPQSSGVPVPVASDLGGYVSTVVAGGDASTSDGSDGSLDGGPGGGGPLDAGAPPNEAGPGPGPGSDAGGSDGGPSGTDSGPPEPDSGPPPADAGPCTPPTSCPPGSVAGACECVDIDECTDPAAVAVCAPTGYPCAETAAPGYTCLGHRADWPMPDVGSGPVAPPSYAASGNGENGLVTDRVTGLVWQARPGRANDTLLMSYAQAEAVCRLTSTGGFSFRVPSLIELVSILDPSRGAAGASNLLADRAYFQGGAANYWTSTPDPATPTLRRLVSFLDGSVVSSSAAVSTARLRCVASPTPVASGTPPTRLAPVVVAGQVLGFRDQRTGIGWGSVVSPQPVDNAGALAYCGTLQDNGATARLPTYKELLTALRLGQAAPYWDAELSTSLGPMWSATPVAGDATRAYLVDFANATAGSAPTTTLAYARCVSVLP